MIGPFPEIGSKGDKKELRSCSIVPEAQKKRIMVSREIKRKLTAILSADVVGYSRLMSDDEAATVASIKRCRKMFKKCIHSHDGKIVDAKGDNLLAKFSL